MGEEVTETMESLSEKQSRGAVKRRVNAFHDEGDERWVLMRQGERKVSPGKGASGGLQVCYVWQAMA